MPIAVFLRSDPNPSGTDHTSIMSKEAGNGGIAVGRPPVQRGSTAVAVALATLVNYVGWLGWDTEKYTGSDGYLHGPYESWQVVGLALMLAVITAVVGWRGHGWVAVVVTALVMTLCFSVQANADPRNDGLWPIGAIMLALGTSASLGLVAAAAGALRRITL
jgi:hypothetical protein